MESTAKGVLKAVNTILNNSLNVPNNPKYKIGGFQEKPLLNNRWSGFSAVANVDGKIAAKGGKPSANSSLLKAQKKVLQNVVNSKGKNYGPVMSSSGSYGNIGLGGSSASSQFLSDPYAYLEYLQDKNTAINIQMNRENNNFAAAQSKLQRDWETEMSNTAHQREVSDLKAAGLNPVLSANAGAAVPAGAAAGASNFVGADHTAIAALAGLLESTLSANAVMTAAGMNASAAMYGADRSLEGTKYASKVGLSGTKYSADKYMRGAITSSGINAAGNIIGGLMRLI